HETNVRDVAEEGSQVLNLGGIAGKDAQNGEQPQQPGQDVDQIEGERNDDDAARFGFLGDPATQERTDHAEERANQEHQQVHEKKHQHHEGKTEQLDVAARSNLLRVGGALGILGAGDQIHDHHADAKQQADDIDIQL